MKPSQDVIRQMKYHTIIPRVLEVAIGKVKSDPENSVWVFSVRFKGMWYTGFGI